MLPQHHSGLTQDSALTPGHHSSGMRDVQVAHSLKQLNTKTIDVCTIMQLYDSTAQHKFPHCN